MRRPDEAHVRDVAERVDVEVGQREQERGARSGGGRRRAIDEQARREEQPAPRATSCRRRVSARQRPCAPPRARGSSAASRGCGPRRGRATRAPSATVSRPRIAASRSSATFCAICSHSGTRGSGVTRASWSRKARAFASPASDGSSQDARARGQVARERVEARLDRGPRQELDEAPRGVLLLRGPEERERASRPRASTPATPARPAPARARSSTSPAARAAGAGGTRRGSTGR